MESFGDGKGTSSNVFVQGQTKKGTLGNILTIGKNNGNPAGNTTIRIYIKYSSYSRKWRYLFNRR
ncbi:MAG: hypothetical protein HFJ50_01625 [Clostridia bacterium]|nr:hypothetical protein [Clostridia bacterium]